MAKSIDIKSLRQRIKKQNNLIRRINNFRKKRAAHWDTEANVLDSVHVGEIRSLLRELEEDIFNKMSGVYNGTVWSFKALQHGDTVRLLDKLK